MSTVLRITEPNAVLPAGGFGGLEELIRRGAAGTLIAEPVGSSRQKAAQLFALPDVTSR